MKKKTYKIILFISVFVMLFVNFSNVFCATNPNYKPSVSVSENALDSKIKSSVLLDTLANMINAIASLAEYLLGGVFKTLTQDNVFPWADRIIFNGIAFLDINFLNPSKNSLFLLSNNSDTILGTVVRQVYSTVFSLAVLFLGVAVGIMAIRLAISTIASEKAKYKEAIVNWATCIVMLFLMHYVLAFVFWINEQMVQIASNILIQTIKTQKLETVDFTEALNSIVEPEQRVAAFCKTCTEFASAPTSIPDVIKRLNLTANVQSNADTLTKNKTYTEVANRLLTNTSYVDERLVYVEDTAGGDWWKNLMSDFGNTNEMMAEIALPRLVYDTKDASALKDLYEKNKNLNKSKGYYTVNNHNLYFDEDAYLKSSDFKKDLAMYAYCMSRREEAADLYSFYAQHPEYKINSGDNPNKWQSSFNLSWKLIAGVRTLGLSEVLNNYSNVVETDSTISAILSDKSAKAEFAQKRLEVDGHIISAATGVKASTTDIIANLGQFFKQSAYVYTTDEVETESGSKKEVVTGWRASKVSVTGALLYAIFIFQSCMYFITYVKRLFFVIMLSMFGPVVVVYDFFMKSVS